MSIEIQNLVKSFDDLMILKNISLEIPTGSVTTIIGPSGSGKSTFLRCLNFLEKPDSGTLKMEGKAYNLENISKQQIKEIRANSAMVFQHYNLFKNKTALENVIEGLITAQNVPKEKAIEEGEKLLNRVGLLHRSANYPSTLSGGEQQRVGIARALAVKPKILLFDEPTSALDPEKVSEVLDVIREIVSMKSSTIIIVTHEMEFAREVSDQVYFMAEGVVVEKGTPHQIFDTPQEERTKSFLRSVYKR